MLDKISTPFINSKIRYKLLGFYNKIRNWFRKIRFSLLRNSNKISKWFYLKVAKNFDSKVIVLDDRLDHNNLMNEVFELYKYADAIGKPIHVYCHIELAEDNLFEWRMTHNYASNLKFIDFVEYKEFVFANLLNYVNIIATLNKNGLSIDSLNEIEREKIIQLRNMLSNELNNLFCYTYIAK